MLRFRSRAPFASRLLIVATCRDTVMSPGSGEGERAGLHDLLFGDPGQVERLPLGGLPIGELERLVKGLVSAPLSAPALATVHEVTEGNPLLVEENWRGQVPCRPSGGPT